MPVKVHYKHQIQKIFATVSQTAALTEIDIDCLDCLDLAKVSKLLLAVDSGDLETIAGKNLVDISVEGTLTQSLFIINIVKWFALSLQRSILSFSFLLAPQDVNKLNVVIFRYP